MPAKTTASHEPKTPAVLVGWHAAPTEDSSVDVEKLTGETYLARHAFPGGLSTFAGPASELVHWLQAVADSYEGAAPETSRELDLLVAQFRRRP